MASQGRPRIDVIRGRLVRPAHPGMTTTVDQPSPVDMYSVAAGGWYQKRRSGPDEPTPTRASLEVGAPCAENGTRSLPLVERQTSGVKPTSSLSSVVKWTSPLSVKMHGLYDPGVKSSVVRGEAQRRQG